MSSAVISYSCWICSKLMPPARLPSTTSTGHPRASDDGFAVQDGRIDRNTVVNGHRVKNHSLFRTGVEEDARSAFTAPIGRAALSRPRWIRWRRSSSKQGSALLSTRERSSTDRPSQRIWTGMQSILPITSISCQPRLRNRAVSEMRRSHFQRQALARYVRHRGTAAAVERRFGRAAREPGG